MDILSNYKWGSFQKNSSKKHEAEREKERRKFFQTTFKKFFESSFFHPQTDPGKHFSRPGGRKDPFGRQLDLLRSAGGSNS